MKHILIGMLLLFACGTIQAQDGLEKIIVEKYYISELKDSTAVGNYLPVGSVTYRIYADMLPGYKFQAVYGVPAHELRIASTRNFFNHADFGGVVANEIPDRNLKDNTVMLDSWISAGGASEFNVGVLKSEDTGEGTIVNEKNYLMNTHPDAGIPLFKQDGLMAGTPPKVTGFGLDSITKIFNNQSIDSVFSTRNGSWACLTGFKGPTEENRVLIAQMTTAGVFSFELNIQIGKPEGGVEQYVAKDPVKEEIYFPGLTYSSAKVDSKVKAVRKSANK